MKISLIIPVCNNAQELASTLPAISAACKQITACEVLFVDGGSSDGSLELLQATALPSKKIFSELGGQAELLNRGFSEAKGSLLFLLAANAKPHAKWGKALEKALEGADLVVGETTARLPKKPSAHGRLAAKLLAGHSKRSAFAHGHALPWGAAANLGLRRSLQQKTGFFSNRAGSASEIDWCWRALMKGAKLEYCKAAVVEQPCPNGRQELLARFERFGSGEAWLHRTYAFLLAAEDRNPEPLIAATEAFQRLRHHSLAAKQKILWPALEEVSTAFACGIRLGYDRHHEACPLERKAPTSAISWKSGAKEITAFVPGKGITTFAGKPLKLWEALQAGATEENLKKLIQRLFGASPEESAHVLAEFRASLG